MKKKSFGEIEEQWEFTDVSGNECYHSKTDNVCENSAHTYFVSPDFSLLTV